MTLHGLSATRAITELPLREIQVFLRRGGIRHRLLAGYWAVAHLSAASATVVASVVAKTVEVHKRLLFSRIPEDYPLELWGFLGRSLSHLIVTVLTVPVSFFYPELTIRVGTILGIFVAKQYIFDRIQIVVDDFIDSVIPFVTHPRTKVTTGLVGVVGAPFGVYKTFREVRDLLGFGRRRQIWDDPLLHIWEDTLLDVAKLVVLFAIPVVTVVAWKKWHGAKKNSGSSVDGSAKVNSRVSALRDARDGPPLPSPIVPRGKGLSRSALL